MFAIAKSFSTAPQSRFLKHFHRIVCHYYLIVFLHMVLFIMLHFQHVYPISQLFILVLQTLVIVYDFLHLGRVLHVWLQIETHTDRFYTAFGSLLGWLLLHPCRIILLVKTAQLLQALLTLVLLSIRTRYDIRRFLLKLQSTICLFLQIYDLR